MNLKEDMYYKSLVRNFTVLFIVSICLLLFSGSLIEKYLIKPVRIDGYSMYPTLDNDEVYNLNLVTAPKRFDIVVFAHDKNTSYIKRLIGLPGDTVEVRKGVLYINGKEQHESYLEDNLFSDYVEKYHDVQYTSDFTLSDLTNGEHTKVPEEYYLVLGDNRPISSDSRDYGLVHKDKIRGHLMGFNATTTYKTQRKQKDLQTIAIQELE